MSWPAVPHFAAQQSDKPPSSPVGINAPALPQASPSEGLSHSHNASGQLVSTAKGLRGASHRIREL